MTLKSDSIEFILHQPNDWNSLVLFAVVNANDVIVYTRSFKTAMDARPAMMSAIDHFCGGSPDGHWDRIWSRDEDFIAQLIDHHAISILEDEEVNQLPM